MKNIAHWIAAAALAACLPNASASRIFLTYVGANATDHAGRVLAQPGDVLTFELGMDFSEDPTIGGAFDVDFDADGLAFVEYVNAGLGDPVFGRDPDVENGRLFSGAFGSFDGLGGPHLIATLSFAVTGLLGEFGVAPTATSALGGPFISSVTFTAIYPDFYGTRVLVTPLPAALWLFASGLMAFMGLRRRA